MKKNLLLRFLTVGFLMLILLVPLSLIHGVVAERQGLQRQVENTIADSMAGPQRLAGPLLVVPYVEHEVIDSTDDRGKPQRRIVDHQRSVFFVPDDAQLEGEVGVEMKYKGLYKALVYQTKATTRVRFAVPANFGIATDPKLLTVGSAYLALGLSDVRGLRSAPQISWAGRALTATNGSGFTALGDGLSADIGVLDAAAAQDYEALVKLNISGTRSLALVPIGKNTTVQLASTWPHPNFGGRFLPVAKTIDASGFKAKWEVSHLASKNGGLLRGGLGERQTLEAFDVAFIEPVNIYLQAERAVKYGILFVALTFAAFFLFETLKNLRIHPLQYSLVGLALALFFLLLVSLSEHIAFALAYLAASGACVALIGYYLAHVLGGWRRGVAFGLKLVLLYAVLYGLLLSEDNALLLGSILLFVVLAAVMVLTRQVNWYAGEAAAEAA